MDPNFFLPHVLKLFQDRPTPTTIPWAIIDDSGVVSPFLRQFVTTTFEWVRQLTQLTFVESNEPWLVVRRANNIIASHPTDGLAEASPEELSLWVMVNPVNDRAKFVFTHELGHLLGLNHPYNDSLHPTLTNAVTAMSGTKRPFTPYREFFSMFDISLLQQAHGVGTDAITGTKKDDKLAGSAVPDVIIGGGGADRLRGGGGEDLMIGGGGQDTFVIESGGRVLIKDFSKKDSIRWKGPGNLDIIKNGYDNILSWQSQEVAYLRSTPFFNKDYII